MSVYRLDKEKFEKTDYQFMLSGEQISRLLKAIEDADIAHVHDIEDILNEGIATKDFYRLVNPNFILADDIQKRYGNPHEWSCVIDVKERTIKVIDTV